MEWTNRLTTTGGGIGGIAAYLMNINFLHVLEIGLYALIGSLIGEGVKELIIFCKKSKG